MDPITVGKKVQELYPEYADKDPGLVGHRYLLKYGDKGLSSLGLEVTTEEEEPVGTSEQLFKKDAASRAVDELERLFGRQDAQNVGTDKDLALAPSATRLGKAKGSAMAFKKSLFDSDFQEDLNTFNAQRDIALGILTQAFGSGTPQEGEAERLIKSAPGPTATDKEAKEWFSSVRTLIGSAADNTKNDVLQAAIRNETPSFTQSTLVPGQDIILDAVNQETGKKKVGQAIDFRNIAQSVADAAPVALGTATGFAGGALGGVGGSIVPGAGTAAGIVGGSAGGVTLGTFAGKAVENTIEDLIGTQDEIPAQQLQDAVSQAGVAGVTDLLLGGGLSIVGKAGNQVIKIAGRSIDDIPLKGLRLNPSQLTNFNKKHGVDAAEFVVKNNLLGEEALERGVEKTIKLQGAFDDLAMNENITIPFEKLKENFASEMRKLAGMSDGGVKTDIVPNVNKTIAKNLLEEWDNIVKQVNQIGIDELTPAQMTRFRKQLDEVIPDSQFINPDVRNTALRVRRIFNETIQDGVDARLIGEGKEKSLKSLGQELSKFYDFLEMAEKQSNLGRGNKLASLIKTLMVGGGASVGATTMGPAGAVVGAGAGLALDALLEDPAVIRALYEAGVLGVEGAKKSSPVMTAISRLTPVLSSSTSEIVSE